MYCCNLSGGVAFIVWFTTNGMCAKKNTIYAWHEQAIRREIATHDLYCCLLSWWELCTHAARAFLIATVQWPGLTLDYKHMQKKRIKLQKVVQRASLFARYRKQTLNLQKPILEQACTHFKSKPSSTIPSIALHLIAWTIVCFFGAFLRPQQLNSCFHKVRSHNGMLECNVLAIYFFKTHSIS